MRDAITIVKKNGKDLVRVCTAKCLVMAKKNKINLCAICPAAASQST